MKTVRLLSTYMGFRPQTIITVDDATGTALLAGGVNATTDLTGGTVYVAPAAPAPLYPARIQKNPDGTMGLYGDGGAFPLQRPAPTIVICGDSITNQNTQTSATFGAHLAKGYWTQAQIMLEQRFELLSNAGVSGNTTAQVLARIDTDVIALRPQYCFLIAGTNDAGQDVPSATTVANYASILGKLQGAGIVPFIGTMTPRGFSGMTQARLLSMMEGNTWLQTYATRTPGVFLVDLYRAMLDYSDINTTSQGEPVAAWVDGAKLHPTAAGAVQMGYAIARQLDAVIPKLPRRLQLNYNGVNGDSSNLIRNGMFMAGSPGTLGLNATGTVAQNWTAGAVAGAIAGVCSIVDRSASFNDDFPGKVQRVAISGSGAPTETFRLSPLMVAPTAGTTVIMEVEVMASASVGTINEISVVFATTGGVVVSGAANYMPTATETLAIGTKVYKGVLQTLRVVVNAGVVGAYAFINIRTSAGAVAQVDFANARFVRVT